MPAAIVESPFSTRTYSASVNLKRKVLDFVKRGGPDKTELSLSQKAIVVSLIRFSGQIKQEG